MQKSSIYEIERQYGKRLNIPMGHGEPLQTHHFRGILDDGVKFVYCPVGFIVSWSAGDYNHEWCHWCCKFFEELKNG